MLRSARSARLEAWIPASLAEPVIGPAKGRTRWLGRRKITRNRLSPRAQAREEFRSGPAVGGQPELDLAITDGHAALEAEHAIHPADIITALFQELLQLARFLEADFRDALSALVHGRGAVEAGRVIGGGQGIVERLIPFQIGLEIVVGQEGRTEPAH